MAAENVISYDTDTIQSIVNTDLSGLSSLNASTYSDEYLTQDFIAKIFDKLNVGDQSALNKWNTIVTQVNGYITSLEETPVPDDVTADPVENDAPPIGDEAPLPEEENPLGDVQPGSAINYETDPRFISPEALAAGVGIGLGAGIGTNPIDGVQPADVAGTPGVEPELPKQPENQPQPEHVQNGDVMDLQGTPGVKPELPKDANMDLHVEGERAPELSKGSGNQTQPEQPVVEPTEQVKPGIDVNTDPRFQAPKQPETPTQPEVETPPVESGKPAIDVTTDPRFQAPKQPEQPEVETPPVVEPAEQAKPGIDVNTDPRFQAPPQPDVPTEPTVEPAKEPGKPAIDVTTDPRFQAPPQPEKPVEQPTVTPQTDVPTEPTVEPAKEPGKPAIDVTTDPRFQAPKQPEQPTQPETPTQPEDKPEPPKVPTDPEVPTQPEQPSVPSFDKVNVFNNIISKLTGSNGQEQIALGMSACKDYMKTNNLTTEQFMTGINDGSIVLTDPNASSFIGILKSSASTDYGTISSTEALIEMLVKLFTILM